MGKNNDGIVKHLTITKRDDAGGVGIETVKAEERDAVS